MCLSVCCFLIGAFSATAQIAYTVQQGRFSTVYESGSKQDATGESSPFEPKTPAAPQVNTLPLQYPPYSPELTQQIPQLTGISSLHPLESAPDEGLFFCHGSLENQPLGVD